MTEYNYSHSIDAFDYDPVNHIASSALAVVYAGRSKRDPSQKVAIKKFGKRLAEERQKHTINDIKIMKELSHPNVVKIITFSLITNMVYLVTEFCNGGDLDDYLREKGALAEDTVRIFLRQVGSGLAYLRERNVVHRDLKPNNILLDYSKHGHSKTKEELYELPTREITFKIVDFGLSKILDMGVGTTTECTPEFFRAPEVFMNWKHDWQVDIWSLGIVTLQCIHGYHPLLTNIDYTRAWQDPKFQFPFLTSTSDELKSLVKNMLERNPMFRITAFDLMNDVFITGGAHAITGPSSRSDDEQGAACVFEDDHAITGPSSRSDDEQGAACVFEDDQSNRVGLTWTTQRPGILDKLPISLTPSSNLRRNLSQHRSRPSSPHIVQPDHKLMSDLANEAKRKYEDKKSRKYEG